MEVDEDQDEVYKDGEAKSEGESDANDQSEGAENIEAAQDGQGDQQAESIEQQPLFVDEKITSPFSRQIFISSLLDGHFDPSHLYRDHGKSTASSTTIHATDPLTDHSYGRDQRRR